MAHFNIKLLAKIICLLLICSVLAGCKVTVEDGGYNSGKIVDSLEDSTDPSANGDEEQVAVPTDGAIGRIVGGKADVYDLPGGQVISTLEEGTQVVTIERTVDWFHIQEGWVMSEFVTLEPDMDSVDGVAGYVHGITVNIRSGPGTDNDVLGQATRNDLVLITETKEDANKLNWGKIQKGWICLDYVTTDLFGVQAMVLDDDTQVMGLAGEGGVITEYDYGHWVTVREVKIVKNVIWGKVSDGWINLASTALSTHDSKDLVGLWRSYNSYNSWNFYADGTFSFIEEDYELKGETLTKKNGSVVYEGSYIYNGVDLMLYYKTVDGKQTESSIKKVTMDAYMSGRDWIFKKDTENPLIKDLTPQNIYDKTFKPTSDPEAVDWINGSWLYFSSYVTNDEGVRAAQGNLLTIHTDGTFSITAYYFYGYVNDGGEVEWTANAGDSVSGTYVYDGTNMEITCSNTVTVKMPINKTSNGTIHASGLDQIMYSGTPNGTVDQSMWRTAGTDESSLCALLKTIF